MEETIEDVLENKPQEVPQVIKILSIFTYIGNGIIMLALLIIFMFMGSFSNSLFGSRFSGELAGILAIVFIIIALLCVGSIIGAAKMAKGKKSGFVIYAICTGIWIVLSVMGYVNNPQNNNIIGIIIPIGFFAGFASQLKHLK